MEVEVIYPGNGDAARLIIKLDEHTINRLNNGEQVTVDSYFGGSEEDSLPVVVVARHATHYQAPA